MNNSVFTGFTDYFDVDFVRFDIGCAPPMGEMINLCKIMKYLLKLCMFDNIMKNRHMERASICGHMMIRREKQ